MGGALKVAVQLGDTLLPILSAEAQSAGRLPRAHDERLCDEFLADLRAALPIDAVLLALMDSPGRTLSTPVRRYWRMGKKTRKPR